MIAPNQNDFAILKRWKIKWVQQKEFQGQVTINPTKPISAGGKTEENNLQTLCKKCNSRKRDNN